MRLIGLLALSTILLSAPALAVEPGEALPDPALEARARAISSGLRCLVCQNQSIDDSNAPLAKDLRLLVRERLQAGDTDAAATDYIVARYGDFVLLKPPFNARTLLLWLTPLLCLLGVGYAIRRSVATSGSASTATPTNRLSADEEARLAKILASPPRDA